MAFSVSTRTISTSDCLKAGAFRLRMALWSRSSGGKGFGFERSSFERRPIRFPHLGGVVIGDNVEVGACNAIVRGTLSDTVIEAFVKTL